MQVTAALKLFGFAIGAALHFSLLTLIRRERRFEKLEVVFLSLIACLFLWNFGSFLLQLFAAASSPLSQWLLSAVVAPLTFGVLAFLPPLLIHIHLLFQEKVLDKPVFPVNRFIELALYGPLLLLPLALADFVEDYRVNDSLLDSTRYARLYALWFGVSLSVSAVIEWKMQRQSRKREDRVLFGILITIFLLVVGLLIYAYAPFTTTPALEPESWTETVLMLWSLVPSALLGYFIFRHNFLEIAIQRSLGYPFALALLLLVYMASVRYISDYLSEQGTPKEVVQAGMILILLPMLQPLKRRIDRSIDGLFSREMSRFEKLTSRLDQISRSTVNMTQMLHMMQSSLQDELNLDYVRIALNENLDTNNAPTEVLPLFERFNLAKGAEQLGQISAQMRSGPINSEQRAALRFTAPQIVAAIEACKLVEGKIELERELAERNRLATLGQMAATVAHNIKNPLSSIKTIVQLMREDEELLVRCGQDLALINSEIDRLTQSVTQLLRFSRPTVPSVAETDLTLVLEKIVQIYRPDARLRNVMLDLQLNSRPLIVRGSEEILSEIFQNLIVNALEASPDSTTVKLRAGIETSVRSPKGVVQIDDEGPGISREICEKIFLPFFTTKQKGTGLGLAVVQRRVVDLAGEVNCISPIAGGAGTRFEIKLPLIVTSADPSELAHRRE